MLTPSVVRTVLVTSPDGIHLRTCSAIVQAVGRHQAAVTIQKAEQAVDAKSILGLMLLDATQGTTLVVAATGREADEAVESVSRLLTSDVAGA
jgi:phosphocarrier protein HPr